MTSIDKQPGAQSVAVNSGEIFAVGERKSVIFAPRADSRRGHRGGEWVSL